MNRLAVAAGQRVRAERLRRGWKLRDVAERARISVAHMSELESGMPVSLETYARVLTALELPLELAAEPPARGVARGQTQDVVHAAMGELEARRLRSFAFEVAMDEPYQHYQFAGRADVVAWDREARAFLHIENRTQFPNIQDVLGSYGSKRAYLATAIATRIGLTGRGWMSETHAIVALWSSEVVKTVKLRETTFRVACPDPTAAFEAWWSGRATGLPRATSAFVLLDPAGSVREAYRFASLNELPSRPRYRNYADAAGRLAQEPLGSRSAV